MRVALSRPSSSSTRVVTCISGPNASGKTTLLESIFLLGRGRSFRTPKLESLIRTHCAELRVVGKAVSGHRTITLGVEASRDAMRARVDGRPVTTHADLAIALPVQSIDPEVHRLIDGGPLRAAPLPRLGCVPRGTIVRWELAPIPESAQATERRACEPGRRPLKYGPGIPISSRLASRLPDSGRSMSTCSPTTSRAPVGDFSMRDIALELRGGWSADQSLAEALERLPGCATSNDSRPLSGRIARNSSFDWTARWREAACRAASRNFWPRRCCWRSFNATQTGDRSSRCCLWMIRRQNSMLAISRRC